MTSIEELIGHEYGNNSLSEDNNNDKGGNKKGKKADKQDDKAKIKREYTTYKYSNKGRSLLHESAIVAGQPVFLVYENNEIKVVQNVEESRRIIKPPDFEEYAYQPYEFEYISTI